MLELTPENALDYLRSTARLGPGPARVEAMGWGVSNAVLRVETPERLFVLKQSRPQLRTRDAWFSDIARVYREQEVMQVLRPLLPKEVVPEVLWSDRENYVFAMSHAPPDAQVWKEVLLDGAIAETMGLFAGVVLGMIHDETARQRHLVESFSDPSVFVQLRVDPFYGCVQQRCPDVAAAVEPLVEQLLTRREALCHGDYSPKNMLVHRSGFTLVDYETAYFGDPTMDLGFFLSHLLLKAIKRRAERQSLFDLTEGFLLGYAMRVNFRPPAELVSRGIGHFGVCLLARVDGTSPVDYLTEEGQRDAARRLGRRVLLERPVSWEEVLALAAVVLGPSA